MAATLDDQPLGGDPEEPRPEGRRLRLTFTGDGFLRHMVRALTGTLLEVGQGKRSVDAFAGLLDQGDRSRAGPTAPPQGLCLARVEY
jgi:tRNA pseudouridine38-40 synthase